MDNFLFSFNSVAPIFIIIFLGAFLKKKSVINDNFASTASKLVFTTALPALIFSSISHTDFTEVFNLRLLLFSILSVLIIFSVITIFSYLLIKDSSTRGAFIQGVFRSNIAIIGMPLIYNIFGDSGFSKSAILLSFVMPLYNVLAVIILTLNSPEEEKANYRVIIFNIIKNPLILASLLAMPFSYYNIYIPEVVTKTIDYLAKTAIPLALFGIGCSFSVTKIRENFRLSTLATFLKLVISPIIVSIIAYKLGFQGEDLVIIFLIFASPTAINSFIMAKAMKSNSNLAADIIFLTTFFSIFTIFIGIYVFTSLGIIIK